MWASAIQGLQTQLSRLQLTSTLSSRDQSPQPQFNLFSFHPQGATSTSAFATSCFRHPLGADTSTKPSTASATVVNRLSADQSLDELTQSIDGIWILILSFLDASSLTRCMQLTSFWRTFILLHQDLLYRFLAERCFDVVVETPQGAGLQSFLQSFRLQIQYEIAHQMACEQTNSSIAGFAAKNPHKHGFIAMFCDICEFPDPQIAAAVAHKRQSALSIVLVKSPENVLAFRSSSFSRAPIAFVPVENPHWPEFDLLPINAPGFLGYAFNHVRPVRGFEKYHHNVIKSILKELVIFDTQEHATSYEQSVGKPVFYAIKNPFERPHPPDPAVAGPLVFSTPLRRRLQECPVQERIERLQELLGKCSAAIESHH